MQATSTIRQARFARITVRSCALAVSGAARACIVPSADADAEAPGAAFDGRRHRVVARRPDRRWI
jgi:hypothetical protein